MYTGNINLRSWAQEKISTAFGLFDLGARHPLREMERRALHETADYIAANMKDAVGYPSGKRALGHALRYVPATGHMLEFGVFKGGSINFIADQFKSRSIHGFDSFQGLPDDWGGWNVPRGTFSLKGRLPSVRTNVTLHPGLFEDTLPKWLEQNPGPVALLHIDCDLYASAQTVVDLIEQRVVAGTVIVFDEYFNFPFWKEHEFKAFHTMLARRPMNYRYLSYARTQTSLVIL